MTDHKTLSVLLKESFSLFKDHIARFIKVVLIAYVPLEIIVMFLLFAITGQAAETEKFNLNQLVLSLLFLLMTVGVTLLYQIAVIRTVESIDTKQALEPVASYQAALDDIGPYLVVLVWVMVKVLLWSLLLIIPGIIFGVFYSFAGFAFLIDKKQGVDALKLSRAVIRPNIWKFIGNSLVAGFMVSLIGFVVRIIVGAIFGFPTGNNPTALSLVGQGVSNTANAFIGVYIFIFYYLMYKELKKTTIVS